jgi:hypothetical protein
MSADEPSRRVSLELSADTEAIHGTLQDGSGRREQFWGWLELMAAIERVTDSLGEPPNERGDSAADLPEGAAGPTTWRASRAGRRPA